MSATINRSGNCIHSEKYKSLKMFPVTEYALFTLFSFRSSGLVTTRNQKSCMQTVEAATTRQVFVAKANAVPMAIFICCFERPRPNKELPEGASFPWRLS